MWIRVAEFKTNVRHLGKRVKFSSDLLTPLISLDLDKVMATDSYQQQFLLDEKKEEADFVEVS